MEQVDNIRKTLRTNFFESKLGETLFFNLVGTNDATEALLEELVNSYIVQKKNNSYCVRVRLADISAEYINGERYGLIWRQIVEQLAATVPVEEMRNALADKEQQALIKEHMKATQNFKPSAVMEKMAKAYESFLNMTDMENDEAIATTTDKWLQDIIEGYNHFRLQILIIIEDFDKSAEIFPMDEEYGCFFSKLFTLSPKDSVSGPKPTPLGIMVVSEKRGGEIAHSMGGSSFEAAYTPLFLEGSKEVS